MAVQGRLWTGPAGCVPSRRVTGRSWCQRSAEPPSSLAVGVQVTLQTRCWRGITAPKLLMSCRRLADPSPALRPLLASSYRLRGYQEGPSLFRGQMGFCPHDTVMCCHPKRCGIP